MLGHQVGEFLVDHEEEEVIFYFLLFATYLLSYITEKLLKKAK